MPPGDNIGCAHLGDALFAMSSVDGGFTWGITEDQVAIINEGTGPCDIRAPSQYAAANWSGVDRPHVTFAGQGPSFYVEWAGGPYAQLCIRHVLVDPITGAITTEGPTHTIVDAGPNDPQPGDVLIRSFAGQLYALYANDFNVPPWGTTGSMSWTLAISGDDGEHWVRRPVWSSPAFSPSFGFLRLGASGNANGIFGFDIDHQGDLWAAVLDSQVTLAGARMPGTPAGTTPIRILRSVDDGATWTTENQPPVTGQVGQVSLVVDFLGNVSVSFYEAAAPVGVTLRRLVTVRDAQTGVWSLPTPISDPFVPTSTTVQQGGAGRIGEYQGVTAIDTTQFPDTNTIFQVWTQPDPMDTSSLAILGARLSVQP